MNADTSDSRERSTANLIPFQKGVSGNPGGRSKALAEFRDQCRDHSPEAVETLLGVMRKEKAMSSAKVQAARTLLAYAWGAPKNEDDTGPDARLIVNILQLALQGQEQQPLVTIDRLATDDA
jgi:hypothetical protein